MNTFTHGKETFVSIVKNILFIINPFLLFRNGLNKVLLNKRNSKRRLNITVNERLQKMLALV